MSVRATTRVTVHPGRPSAGNAMAVTCHTTNAVAA